MGVHVSIQIQSGAAGLEADGTGQKLLLRASARRRCLLSRGVLHHLNTDALVTPLNQTNPFLKTGFDGVPFYLLGGWLLSALLLEALPPLHRWTAAFGGGGGADGE